jgi:hypothetical protein
MDVVCPDDSASFLRVYFGSASGFDSSRSRYYPTPGGGAVDVADLDGDGHADLVHSGWRARNLTVYWGTDSGPSPSDTTSFGTVGMCEAVRVFNMNRDEYLDIVCGTDTGTVLILWGTGGGRGWRSTDTSVVSLDGQIGQNLEIADLDKDSWPDIAAVAWTRNCVPIVYGGPGPKGWQARRVDTLPTADGKPHGVTVADLDADGWLDLVYNTYDNGTSAFIYYGSEQGFSPYRRDLIFPGQCFGGSAAVYWDADTLLDLVFFRGEYRGTPSWTPVVYFNRAGGRPHFEDTRKANIGSQGFNAAGGLVADFNRDGHQDVFVSGYRANDHSYVLWGPNFTTRDALPSNKSHHAISREPGDAYSRGRRETYLSSVFARNDSTLWRSISWDASTPGGSSVEVAFRTGNTPEPGPEWSQWMPVANGDTIAGWLATSRFQYRAVLGYAEPTELPELFEVRVDYESLPWLDVGATALLSPSGVYDSGANDIPRAVVRNFGDSAANAPVTMRIGGPYLQTVYCQLAVGQTDTVEFPVWSAAPPGMLLVSACTRLSGDRVRANDTVWDTVQVRKPPSTPDVMPSRILVPGDSADSGSIYVPAAVVRNQGQMTVVFPVTMRIGAAYAATVSETLAGAVTDTIRFAAWTADPRGTLDVVCFTALAGDPYRRNDTVRSTVAVGPAALHDIGVAAIRWPAQVRGGDAVLPGALVRNYGSEPERLFDIRCRIGGAYNRTLNFSGTLAPGDSAEVTFPAWYATRGTHVVSCSTMLAGDLDRSNDRESLVAPVTGFAVLHVKPDQSAVIQCDSVRFYGLWALLESDVAALVDFLPFSVPAGWQAEVYDSAGTSPLSSTLGTLEPDRQYWFSLRVQAPGPDLSGVNDSTERQVFAVGLVARSDSSVSDTVFLTITLAPELTIHSFPNPCRGQASFIVGLPEPGAVTLTLYNRAGELVRTLRSGDEAGAGVLLVDWDGTNDAGRSVASGTYRYVLDFEHGGTVSRLVRKLVLVRE